MPINFSCVTWNVENLFQPNAGASADAVESFQRKLAFLARAITLMSPDVVALQEVGEEAALADLQAELAGAYPQMAISQAPDRRGIRVGFLSRWRLAAAPEDIVDFPEIPALAINDMDLDGNAIPIRRMGRGARRVRVERDGHEVELVTVHLKSKLLSYPPFPGQDSRFGPRNENERSQEAAMALIRRAAEATTVRFAVNRLLEDQPPLRLVVLGDLNDVPSAASSQILNGPEGSQIGTGAFEFRDQGDATRLFNLAPLIPEIRRFSRVHDGVPELLDQILVSEELLPEDATGRRRLPLRVDSFLQFSDGMPSVSDDPALRAGAERPDHAPVFAEFVLGD